MKILIDTCIVMDYLQDRVPFSDEAETILEMGLSGAFEPFFTAKAVADVNYIVRKYYGDSQEKKLMTAHLWQLMNIADTSSTDAFNALFSEMKDYEDALMVATAERLGLDAIVTRNVRDYTDKSLAVYSPTQLIGMLSGK